MVGTLFGVAVFLSLLMMAVEFLIRLYATSVLTSVAFDAARSVADDPASQAGQATTATVAARHQLGAMGRTATFDWREVDGQQVVLQVTAYSPGFAPLPESFRRIDRTVVVRTERFR
jgi:Flp pilus assembly protein TadG